MDTFACEPSWVRVTEEPVTSSTFFEDETLGGLNGCYWYAVRAVGPNFDEGPIERAAAVYAMIGDGGQSCYWNQESGDTSQYQSSPPPPAAPGWFDVPMTDELERVNDSSRGSSQASGAPSAPTNVTLKWGVHDHPVTAFRSTKYAILEWNANTESDLAGYHVEMAGAAAGPWQRLTKNPVAWWETTYFARGLGVRKSGSTSYSGILDCRYFRVIAVDEYGLESPPSMAQWAYGDCGAEPTPPPPSGLTATTAVGAPTCHAALTWDDLDWPDPVEYAVYRMRLHAEIPFFYVTQYVSAAECTNGVCTYLEDGDESPDEDPNEDCPWLWHPAHPYLCDMGIDQLNAFYVTARGATGSESPRSQVVFWHCTEEYARNEAAEEALYYLAESVSLLDDQFALDLQVCPIGDYRVSGSSPHGDDLRTAPMMRLGQSSTDPPFTLYDLHHDHLGSTRVVTDDTVDSITVHDFFPFGEEVTPMADFNTKMFTGHERDRETGLDYMLARYYGNSLPRFLSPDPIGGAEDRPQTFNRYTYVGNNPLNVIDPTGMYGINPNPYNPQGTNPCDGMGPMCIRVEAGRKVKDGKKKAKELEEASYEHYKANKKKYEESYGTWGYTPEQVEEMFTPGKGPKVKLKKGMKNLGYKFPGLPSRVYADQPLDEQVKTVVHELVHRAQGRRGTTPEFLPTSPDALNNARQAMAVVRRFPRAEFIAYAVEYYVFE